jgi:hypothetical protein
MHPARTVLPVALAAALSLPPYAGAADAVPSTHETPIVVRVDDGGFGWTDAALGVVAGVGATLVTAGGVALLRLRRPTRSNEKGSRQ